MLLFLILFPKIRYIYIYQTLLSKATYIAFKLQFYILSALAFPGNRTHDLGVASAMLYHLSYRKATCNLKVQCFCSSSSSLMHSVYVSIQILSLHFVHSFLIYSASGKYSQYFTFSTFCCGMLHVIFSGFYFK